MLAGVLGVGHPDDAEQDHEQADGAEDQAAEAGRLVAWLGRAHATRTWFMTSFFLICFITSRPPVILPNTVWTPFRCRVLSSESTMKNWLPPVSLPACAIERAPTSCLRGFPAVSHLIRHPGPPDPTRGSPSGRSREWGSPPCTTKSGMTR